MSEQERRRVRTVFNGEAVSGRTGESTPVTAWTDARVAQHVRKMRDGDALVINAEDVDW